MKILDKLKDNTVLHDTAIGATVGGLLGAVVPGPDRLANRKQRIKERIKNTVLGASLGGGSLAALSASGTSASGMVRDYISDNNKARKDEERKKDKLRAEQHYSTSQWEKNQPFLARNATDLDKYVELMRRTGTTTVVGKDGKIIEVHPHRTAERKYPELHKHYSKYHPRVARLEAWREYDPLIPLIKRLSRVR